MWERCPLCPSRNLPEDKRKFVVPGDGPDDAQVMGIAEAPGGEEANRHRVFVGKAGDELNNTYLQRAGLSRDSVYLTNSCKCHWADSSDAPPEEVVRSCADFHLKEEIARIKPKLIVLMGGVANSLMGWDVDQEHGVMHPGQKLYGFTGDIYSTFHPALGLHMGSKMQALLDDFRDLRDYMRGIKQPVTYKYADAIMARVRTASDVEQSLGGTWEDNPIGIDTESVARWKGYRSTIQYTPWCVTYCAVPGRAYMIRVVDAGALQMFKKLVKNFRKLYFQNFPHDDWQLTQMGIRINEDRVYDTMSGAYHDGRLAHGLKYLSYRLLGHRMTSFDEVVKPHSRKLALEFLMNAACERWPEPVQEATGEMVQRNCPACKGKGLTTHGRGKFKKSYWCDCDNGKVTMPQMTRKHSINQKLNGLLTRAASNPKLDLWDSWENWEDSIQPLIDGMGAMPWPSIDYVPEDEAIVYACGDAHDTRLLGPIMEQRVAKLRRSVRDAVKR